jgi:hypothetical protein
MFSSQRLSSLDTSASNWSIVPSPDDLLEWEFGRGKRSTRRIPVPVPLRPQIPHDVTWDRTRAAVEGSWRLIAELWHGPLIPFIIVDLMIIALGERCHFLKYFLVVSRGSEIIAPTFYRNCNPHDRDTEILGLQSSSLRPAVAIFCSPFRCLVKVKVSLWEP